MKPFEAMRDSVIESYLNIKDDAQYIQELEACTTVSEIKKLRSAYIRDSEAITCAIRLAVDNKLKFDNMVDYLRSKRNGADLNALFNQKIGEAVTESTYRLVRASDKTEYQVGDTIVFEAGAVPRGRRQDIVYTIKEITEPYDSSLIANLKLHGNVLVSLRSAIKSASFMPYDHGYMPYELGLEFTKD